MGEDIEQTKEERDRQVYGSVAHKAGLIHLGKGLRDRTFHQGTGKCFSCEHSFVYRVARRNDPIVQCNESYTHAVMPHDITDCSRYQQRGELSVMDLIKLYSVVDLGVSDKVMGFKQDLPPTIHS